MTTNELKSCPFCGGRAKHVYFRFTDTHSVWCRNCGAESYEFDTEEEAIEAWNTRAERTCRNVAVQGVLFECSECGAKTVDAVGNYTQEYCAACGRKVQDAD